RLRTQNTDALYSVAGEILKTRDTAYWLQNLPAWDIPASRVNTLDDLESDPHLASVDFFQDIPDGNDGVYRYPRSPVHIEGMHVPLAGPPKLGEHTEELLRTTRLSEALIQKNSAALPSNHNNRT